MDEENRQKLCKLWDFIEKVSANAISYEMKRESPSWNDILDKFEELFTEELNLNEVGLRPHG